MKKFFDASPLLEDRQAIQQQLDKDGYLFLREIIDPDILRQLRKDITDICKKHHWLKEGTDPYLAISDKYPVVEGDEEYFDVYDEVQCLESLHSLAHEPKLLNTMKWLIGDSAFPHPLSISRIVFPNNNDWATPPHQDYPNNQGTENLYASWIPLGECSEDSGGLAVLEGSHKPGLLPVKYSLGAGHRQCILDERHQKLNWVTGEFAAGDILIFHSLTVHRSLPNDTTAMRLSVDYRYQREGEPVTENCLLPHFQRFSWDQIYASWKNKGYQYYWKDKNLPISEWDTTLNALAEGSFKEDLKTKILYDRDRQKRFNR